MKPQQTPAAKMEGGFLLTDTDVAALYGVAVNTVRNWRSQGTGPAFVKLGKRAVRYRPEDVASFIAGNDGKAAAA